jgi:hypothetical protein
VVAAASAVLVMIFMAPPEVGPFTTIREEGGLVQARCFEASRPGLRGSKLRTWLQFPAVSLVLEVVEDFDAAVERVAQAPDLRMVRRAIREALGHLFTVREHRRATLGGANYHALAGGCSDGRITEAVLLLRNALIHQVRKPVTPEYRDVYSDIYSDKYGSLVWLQRSEMTNPPNTLTANYDQEVGGKNVFITLSAARRFLVEPNVLGTLR